MARGQCPAGWTEFQSRCFLFSSKKKPWIQAEKHCLKLGGNLASVHSPQEYHLIQKFTTENAWIGGHDAVEEGQWLWSDGSPFLYTKWTPRQPDNHNEEDCLCINYKGKHYME
ncbi:galactose-specific lectin nattectin-like [Megalops cyprinoides]|uniref:galactose-specific lectin nattectin-like n=1 Tax=Megalops cyprinoides TaxID=118141 RepID=UPI00186522F6|nr:galactose-specific lectin nattectin-like [Megalops cyprinoides]